jgi:uncharacterized protein YdhG (YjbR/CyaY superfamily)
MAKQSLEVNKYIASFPPETQAKMEQLRACIVKAAPHAEECWSYQMPAYKQNGMLVYFAAYKNHLGFYPTSSGITNFQQEITTYKHSKGAIQFPLDKAIPLALVTKIVKHRVQVNEVKVAEKQMPYFISGLSAPTKRALKATGINTLKQLSKYSKQSILQLHGIGPSAIPKLEHALKEMGLQFKS